MSKSATLYRMATDEHLCPYGIKSKDLLKREGFRVDDHLLTSSQETERFKEKEGVKTTPQTFIDGHRVGGYDDLREHFGKTEGVPGDVEFRQVASRGRFGKCSRVPSRGTSHAV